MSKNQVISDAQRRQNLVPLVVEIDRIGDWNWATLLAEEVEVSGSWVEICGAAKVSHYHYCQCEARVNGVSVECVIFGELMDKGYVLEELEIEFEKGCPRHSWGVCTWRKDDPSYHQSSKEHALMLKDPSNPYHISLFFSVFDTEKAGRQRFSLASTQMFTASLIGDRPPFLFHKTIVFRRARFSPPKVEAVAS
jgi:hypothetical protein